MISLTLKDHIKNFWYVTLPYEINNEFLFNVDQYTKKNATPWWHLDVWASDFADVEFPPEKLDQLYHDFDVLEKNLDEIIKTVPLPEKIGGWESYQQDFLFIKNEWREDFNKYFPNKKNDFIDGIINFRGYIEKPTSFTKSDMLLIISLIKKKILEAKEKNETLVFSGD